jgi:hypothetical protein
MNYRLRLPSITQGTIIHFMDTFGNWIDNPEAMSPVAQKSVNNRAFSLYTRNVCWLTIGGNSANRSLVVGQ